MRKIRKILLHVTDSPDNRDIGFKEINDWHKARGWMSPTGISCGYHYIIRRDGTVEKGRPDEEVGAHVAGHNKDSIGVVWVGKDKPSIQQNYKILHTLRYLLNKYNLNPSDIYGHHEYDDGKSCPNLNMNTIRSELLFTFEEIKDCEIRPIP